MEIERFISNESLIAKKCSQWTKLADTADGWGSKYYNPVDNSNWILVRLETEYHGGGFPVLIKEPEPNQSELIENAFSTSDMNVVATSGSLLFINERDLKMEFREELIERLERHNHQSNFFEAARIETLIYESGLCDSTNLRPTIGKSVVVINEDFLFYKSIADRAKKIITTVKQKS